MKTLLLLSLMIVIGFTSAASAADYQKLQSDWAIVNYQTTKDRQFEALAADAEKLVAENPDSPEIRIWYGIILSSWAGVDGGLGALSRVKEARRQLETALDLDPMALQGSAYTSLGALYYQVPSWPVAFGNKKEAEKLLRQALEISPNGIDSNYFMGDYLFNQQRYDEARASLQKALAAPPRPGRELADRGRRLDIETLMSQM